jgi:hypothetical protein
MLGATGRDCTTPRLRATASRDGEEFELLQGELTLRHAGLDDAHTEEHPLGVRLFANPQHDRGG